MPLSRLLAQALLNKDIMKHVFFFCLLVSFLLPSQQVVSGVGPTTMLYFYQDGCPWCARMDIVLRDAEIAALLARHNRVIRVNVRDRRIIPGLHMSGEALVKRFGVKGTPTILFIDGAGKILLTIPGALGREDFLDVVCASQAEMQEEKACRSRGEGL